MKPTLMTTAHVACWTIRERSSSRMGRWSLERSTALKPAAASPCRATAWRFAAWLRLKKAWRSEEKIFWKPPKSIKKKKNIQIPKITQFKNQMIPNGLFEKKKSGAHLVDSTWSSGASKTTWCPPLWSYTSQGLLWSHQHWRPPNDLDVDSMLPPHKRNNNDNKVLSTPM